MGYVVLLEKRADRQLRSLNYDIRLRVSNSLVALQEGFSSQLDIKKLKGMKDRYRVRVGKYRVLFHLTPERTIIVFAILPRERAYE